MVVCRKARAKTVGAGKPGRCAPTLGLLSAAAVGAGRPRRVHRRLRRGRRRPRLGALGRRRAAGGALGLRQLAALRLRLVARQVLQVLDLPSHALLAMRIRFRQMHKLRERVRAAIASLGLQTLSRAKFLQTIDRNISIMTTLYLTLAIIIAFGVIYNSARIQLSAPRFSRRWSAARWCSRAAG